MSKDCPRAKSDMTPCVIKDGELARADTRHCVGCDIIPENDYVLGNMLRMQDQAEEVVQ